jgi:cell division protein FtsL
VNKLGRREYDYIKGNTVLAPERKIRIRKPDKKYNKIKSRNTLLKNKRKNDRKYMITVAVFILGLGFLTITGDAKVYKMQNKVSQLNSQIRQTQEECEALKVKILKFSALNNIQEKAHGKLSMFVPKKEETVKVDFSKNYFEDLKPKSSENNTKENNLFSKLKNLIK